jgi:GT2 family glycosyltransferase
VAFLDDDDEWLPEKLEKELEVFRNSDREVGLVYSGRMLVDQRGRVLAIRMPTKSGWVHEALLDLDFIRSPSGAMLKKEVLDRVEGFDETCLNCEDYELWLRVTKVSKVACVPCCLVKQHLISEWKGASLRNLCEGWERILAKHRSEMKASTLARHLSRVAILLFNYEPRRARALAWEGLRLRPLQRSLLVALAVSTLGTSCYRWVYRTMARWRDRYYLGRARI